MSWRDFLIALTDPHRSANILRARAISSAFPYRELSCFSGTGHTHRDKCMISSLYFERKYYHNISRTRVRVRVRGASTNAHRNPTRQGIAGSFEIIFGSNDRRMLGRDSIHMWRVIVQVRKRLWLRITCYHDSFDRYHFLGCRPFVRRLSGEIGAREPPRENNTSRYIVVLGNATIIDIKGASVTIVPNPRRKITRPERLHPPLFKRSSRVVDSLIFLQMRYLSSIWIKKRTAGRLGREEGFLFRWKLALLTIYIVSSSWSMRVRPGHCPCHLKIDVLGFREYAERNHQVLLLESLALLYIFHLRILPFNLLFFDGNAHFSDIFFLFSLGR